MNNPFDYIPDPECDKAFQELTERIEILKQSERSEDIRFCRELEAGKMLGVLIAVDARGERNTLYAFSGQIGDGGFDFPGFVGPVFDYLQPDGYFKTKEADISRQNAAIREFENGTLSEIRKDYLRNKALIEAEIGEYREKCRLSKLERDAKRKSGSLSDAERDTMIRQSQFEKAELHRLKKKMAEKLHPYSESLKDAEVRLEEMKRKRREDSESLQEWLFSNFRVLNARGESKSLGEIFAETPFKIPPSGAGECCAPKLLQAAYMQGLRPEAIAEYWYGKPKGGEVRLHGVHYPACRGKCLPVLSWMLQGLAIDPPLEVERTSSVTLEPEIIFESERFCVVNKPSGMLSVPGKGHAKSVQKWLEEKYGPDRFVKLVHRLDQDTSGLLVAALSPLTHQVMQGLFASRRVKKTYIADLEGDYRVLEIPPAGRIEVPLSPDWLDRPRQRIDEERGKSAVTDYEFISAEGGRSRVIFHPLTGRTHQLRVHAASAEGLGMPIVGDRLYGKNQCSESERLHLHAYKIEFTFPFDCKDYSFEAPLPF